MSVSGERPEGPDGGQTDAIDPQETWAAPDFRGAKSIVRPSLKRHLLVVNASDALQIEDAFAALVQDRVEAFQIGVDPLFGNHVDQLVAPAARHKVPTIYPWCESAGGLVTD